MSACELYDAMYGQAWSEYEALARDAATSDSFPTAARDVVKTMSRLFFDFAVADLPPYQLVNQRSVPGFTPSAEAYAPSVRTMQLSLDLLAAMGVTDRGDVEIWFALLGGLSPERTPPGVAGTSLTR